MNGTKVTLNLSLSLVRISNDETKFLNKLLLTDKAILENLYSFWKSFIS